ncbi:MAG TPA: hypothetical protein VMS31_03720 [Pyrinomonadaceae bacterium]|nr:hypothetical protein [Pyrinomonadaceae bacterium]
MHETKTAEAIYGYTYALEIRQLNSPIIANYHKLHMAAAIYQGPNLSARLMRQFGQLPRKFRRHNLVRGDAPGIEFGYSAKLVLF